CTRRHERTEFREYLPSRIARLCTGYCSAARAQRCSGSRGTGPKESAIREFRVRSPWGSRRPPRTFDHPESEEEVRVTSEAQTEHGAPFRLWGRHLGSHPFWGLSQPVQDLSGVV